METLLFIIHIIGIISFSAAGAMVAIDKEADAFGVVFLSVITCFGGGVIRDVIAGGEIGRNLPILFVELKTELMISIVTAIVVFVIAALFKQQYVKEENTVDRINNILDALGIGVFSAAGTQDYMGVGFLVAIIMGMISSIGGSITRDVILGKVPVVLRKRIYALATLFGSVVYYVVAKCVMPLNPAADVVATLCCVISIFIIRMCATHYKWNMPKAIDFSVLSLSESKPQETEKNAKNSKKNHTFTH